MGRMTLSYDGTELEAKASTGNKQWVARIDDTHPKYNYDRDFIAYQKTKTSERDSGTATVEDGDVIEEVWYSHGGREKGRVYYQARGGELHQIDDDEVADALNDMIVGSDDDDHDDPGVEVPQTQPADETETCVERVRCSECGKQCASEHGVAIHAGKVHDSDGDEDTAADTTDDAIVADGGVDVGEYDLDPTQFDYDIKNSTRHKTNNYRSILGRIDGTDIWVAYRTWQTGTSDYSSAIEGIGRLSINGTEPDVDVIAETIRDRATRDMRDDRDEWDASDKCLLHLAQSADQVAEAAAEEWQVASEEVVGDNINEGSSHYDSNYCWASHVEEAFRYEAENALRRCGVEEDDDGRVASHVRSGLYEAVNKKRDTHLRPHLEYEVALDMDIAPWELRALELVQNGIYRDAEQTAKVVALREEGKRQSEVAEILGVHQSTVSRHQTRADELRDRAEWTAERGADR